jgi:hypothetical protein
MDYEEKARKLSDILEKRTIYLWCEPEVIDFTVHQTGKIFIQSAKGTIELTLDRDSIWKTLSLLSVVLSKDNADLVLTWNIKSLFSYFRFYGAKSIIPTTSIIDLNVIENFLNIRKRRPENLVEAINRGKIVSVNKNWTTVYKAIHQPLMFKVLPALETTPLLNESNKQRQYAFYEIEGQTNGRINCLKKFKYGYLPTTMSAEVRRVLKPRGYNTRVLSADYRACEVSVLQWLSGDETLKQILDSGEDLHTAIFRIVTNSPCDTDEKRRKSKLMFLPVMYGCGVNALSKNMSISEDTARSLINRINSQFSTAAEWMNAQQKAAGKGEVSDYHGRMQHYKEGESYRFRNACVQGVAATFCQEKLVDLCNALESTSSYPCFYIHDGYGVVCTIKEAKVTYDVVKKTLETESRLCPGLAVKTEIKFGAKLEPMKTIWK